MQLGTDGPADGIKWRGRAMPMTRGVPAIDSPALGTAALSVVDQQTAAGARMCKGQANAGRFSPHRDPAGQAPLGWDQQLSQPASSAAVIARCLLQGKPPVITSSATTAGMEGTSRTSSFSQPIPFTRRGDQRAGVTDTTASIAPGGQGSAVGFGSVQDGSRDSPAREMGDEGGRVHLGDRAARAREELTNRGTGRWPDAVRHARCLQQAALIEAIIHRIGMALLSTTTMPCLDWRRASAGICSLGRLTADGNAWPIPPRVNLMG